MLKKPDLSKPVFTVFPEKAERAKEGKCTMCGKEIKEADFKDNLSKKEYSLSGLCQSCQDDTFNR